MISWLSTFLSNRQQRVKIADVMSDWLILRGGIPQGSCLGPLIFLILIDDLKLYRYSLIPLYSLQLNVPSVVFESRKQRFMDKLIDLDHFSPILRSLY